MMMWSFLHSYHQISKCYIAGSLLIALHYDFTSLQALVFPVKSSAAAEKGGLKDKKKSQLSMVL